MASTRLWVSLQSRGPDSIDFEHYEGVVNGFHSQYSGTVFIRKPLNVDGIFECQELNHDMTKSVNIFNKYIKDILNNEADLSTKARTRLSVNLRWLPMTIGYDIESRKELVVQDLVISEMVEHLSMEYNFEKSYEFYRIQLLEAFRHWNVTVNPSPLWICNIRGIIESDIIKIVNATKFSVPQLEKYYKEKALDWRTSFFRDTHHCNDICQLLHLEKKECSISKPNSSDWEEIDVVSIEDSYNARKSTAKVTSTKGVFDNVKSIKSKASGILKKAKNKSSEVWDGFFDMFEDDEEPNAYGNEQHLSADDAVPFGTHWI